MKKIALLSVLFFLPITAYLFFASGVNNFAKLPVITPQLKNLEGFKTIEGNTVNLEGKITVLGFFGDAIENHKALAYNLSHKIYKKNYQFNDFQFVFLATPSQKQAAAKLKAKIATIADTLNFKIAFANKKQISNVFNSMQLPLQLDSTYSTNYVFLIDKTPALRGRKDDEDYGILYGYNAADYAEINNKMDDDVKVLLAEYRLALKKYNRK